MALSNFPQALLDALRCPICGDTLADGERQLRCPAGHSFDQARQGYVHLGAGRRLPDGDSVAMVEARAAIQSAGLFQPLDQLLRDALSTTARPFRAGRPASRADLDSSQAAAPDAQPTDAQQPATAPDAQPTDAQPPRPGTRSAAIVVDLGAGTGHYLATVLDALPSAAGLAMDVSKPALRRAAKAHPRAGAALADTWGELPLAGASVDLLLNVFAPRNGPEMRRVLRPGGLLLVVTPTEAHLGELRTVLGLLDVDPHKQDRLEQSLAAFTRVDERLLSWPLRLDRTQAAALVAMGPNAHHLDQGRLAERLAALTEPIPVTAAVRLSVFA